MSISIYNDIKLQIIIKVCYFLFFLNHTQLFFIDGLFKKS